MLSSGTLNLKFMQRNNVPPKKPKLEDSPVPHSSHLTTSSSDGLQSKRPMQETADTKGKRKHAEHVKNESKTQTIKIIYEDSLMGFPLLSASSSSTPVLNSASDLSKNVGRKSYGEFNKTVEKLDQTTTTDNQPEASVATTSRPSSIHSNRTKPGSRNQQIGSRPSRHDSGPVPETRKRPKPSPPPFSAAHILNTEQTTGTSTTSSGFQKPFSATSIKSKRKKVDLSASTNESLNSPSTSQRKKKARREPEAREVIEISGDDSSDNDDLVSREIENMFLEARKAKRS